MERSHLARASTAQAISALGPLAQFAHQSQ